MIAVSASRSGNPVLGGVTVLVGLIALVTEDNKEVVESRTPKNALPDQDGPPNGKLERHNPQTGELLQEKWYDGEGVVYKEKNYGHDHDGSGDPHMHDWDYPSLFAPNPVRGPARPPRSDE
jgi:hypothetical protein